MKTLEEARKRQEDLIKGLADPMSVPKRRIDDRIRQLCAKATSASNGDAESALQELLVLVHLKAERLKGLAARLLLNGQRLDGERRKSFQ